MAATMSAEPDFTGLRTDVEAVTRLPEFDSVAKRAKRIRRRDLGRRFAVSLLAVAALAPAGTVALNATPGGGNPILGRNEQIGPDRTDAVPSPAPSTSPSAAPVVTIRAIAGARIGALYAAADVCRPGDATTNCSLQVLPLGTTAQDQRGPIAVDELRDDPADSLTDVGLTSLTPTSLLLSGIRQDGQRKSRRINLGGGGAEIAPEPQAAGAPQPQPGDQVVQLSRYGELSFVRQLDARAFRTAEQPDLDDVTLVTSIAQEVGWWVTGTDPKTGEVSVGVSRDQGRSWQVAPVGLRPGMADPVVATGDGTTVFLYLRTAGGIQQRRSVDGGRTWTPVTSTMSWPSFSSGGDVVSRQLGAVVRTDGSLLIWVEEPPGAVFLESVDGAASYRSVSGPSGPIVTVQGGFVALGDPPVVSYDGHTWSALPRPAVLPPD
jgi:hypothetical protein